MKNNVPMYFTKIELFIIFETKISLSSSVLLFAAISQISKKKCMYFGYEQVET